MTRVGQASRPLALVTEAGQLTKRALLLFDRIFILGASLESLEQPATADLAYLEDRGIVEVLPSTLGALVAAGGGIPAHGVVPAALKFVEVTWELVPGLQVGIRNYGPSSFQVEEVLDRLKVPLGGARFAANLLNALASTYWVVPRATSFGDFSSQGFMPIRLPADLDGTLWFGWPRRRWRKHAGV